MSDESQISEREREILRFVATGATNQQIATQLNISINTVKVHLRNIFSKIGVESRTEATLYAVRTGLVQIEGRAAPVAVAEVEVEAAPDPAPPPVVVAEPPPPIAELPPTSAHVAPARDPTIDQPAPPSALQRIPLPVLLAAAVLLAVAGTLAVMLAIRGTPAGPSAAPTAAPPQGANDDRWRTLAPMPAPRSGFALAGARFDSQEYLFVIGGEGENGASGDVLRYDLIGNSWALRGPKPLPVGEVQAVAIGGKIYVPGGRAADGTISRALEVYDPQRDTWERRADLPAPRSRYALAAVEGKLYLFGGWDGADFRAEVWSYSPEADSWTEQTSMPAPSADAGAAVIDGQVYLLGGANSSGLLNVNQRYNPADESLGSPWTTRAPLPAPRAMAGVAMAGGLILAFGGTGDTQPSVYYISSQDTWSTIDTRFEAPLRNLRAYAVGEKIYLFGGATDTGVSAETYEYQAVYTAIIPIN